MYKLITAILPGHKCMGIIQTLKDDYEIITANKHSVRGESIYNRKNIEMETISVLVEESKADEVFEYIFFEAKLHDAHRGLIYQEAIKKASKYSLPEL